MLFKNHWKWHTGHMPGWQWDFQAWVLETPHVFHEWKGHILENETSQEE